MIVQERQSINSAVSLGKGGGHHHPHFFSHGGRHEYLYEPLVYYLPDDGSSSSIDDEVAFHERLNECIVIRRGTGGANQVRQAVVNKLKSRGWEDRMEVSQEGHLNVKTLLLCPPGAEKGLRGEEEMHPPAALVARISRSNIGHVSEEEPRVQFPSSARIGYVNLGQTNATLHVIVMDRRGQPGSGVPIVIVSDTSGNIGEGETDGDGVFVSDIPTGMGEATVIASLPEGDVRERVLLAPLGATVATIRSIRKISGPFLTFFEGFMGVAGIVGFATDEDLLKMLGEGAFFAAVFARVARE